MTIHEHFLSTSDREQWERYLPTRASVFGSLGYAQIGEKFLGRNPRLYVVESGRGWIAHPMLLRSLTTLPFRGRANAMWDIATPEYTGPFLFGDGEEVIEAYLQKREAMAVREGIVAEFAHLNPWADGKSILQEGAAYDRDIVWVDTTLTPESLWASHIDHACRKNIGKAQRAGLRSVEATSKEDIREFLRIYSSTMARKNALESYRFSLEYFEAFQEKLPEGSRFTLTMAGDHIAGALLVLFDDENAYSYLGGTDAEFHHLRPSNFATWELIQWAHAGGKKRVVLGGGYRPDDGIFRFKATFSNLRQPFHVYKKIHLPDEYSYLEQENRNVNGITESTIPYFPSYRYVNS